MASKLFNQLNTTKSSVNNNGILSLLKNSSNPQQLLMNLAERDPRIAALIKEIGPNGINAKDMFYRKAKEMGVNPDDILNQLKNL